MIIRKVILVYFSPTGTTQKAITAFAEGMGAPVEKIDLTAMEARKVFNRSFSPAELLLTGLPVYGGRLPKNIDNFFSGLKGNSTPAVATVTYGNRDYDDALLELKLRLEERGFIIKAAAAFVGEHSFSRNIATGRPDANDIAIASSFGRQAAASIAGDASGILSFKGSYPYTAKGSSLNWRPVTTENCNRCGICAENCPWGAIDPEDYSTRDGGTCAFCLRCVKICPVGARQVKDEKFLAWLPQFEARLNARRREPELFLPQ